MNRFTGKVVFVTGAARGQGRSHALGFAAEGADIIALDICRQLETVPYPMATRAELDETVAAVVALGRRAIAIEADVRDAEILGRELNRAVAELGRLDVVCANAGVVSYGMSDELGSDAWDELVGTNLKGVWLTAKVAVAHLQATGRGGSIIITASTAAFHGTPALPHYASAKHGTIGLTRTLALELGQYGIRVNVVCPGTVRTPMVENDNMFRLRLPDEPHPDFDRLAAGLGSNPLGVPYVESVDVTNAVLFLASDEARYINAVALPIDCGALA